MNVPAGLAVTVIATALTAASCASTRPAAAPPAAAWLDEEPRTDRGPRLRFEASLDRASSAPSSFWRTLLWVITGAPDDEEDDRRLGRPFDVEPDPAGGLFIADPDLSRVVRYGADGKVRAAAECAGLPWGAPMALAAAPDGALWVADAANGAVVRWTEDGCKSFPLDAGARPTGLAWSGDRLFIADPPNHRVLALAADGSRVGAWGERGDGDGQFNYPTDVAAALDGTLYVVDALNFRVARLSRDGAWLGAFGAPGESGPNLARPKGIHVDRRGHVLVSDAQRDQVLEFAADGTFLSALGHPGDAPGHFAHPAGITTRGEQLIVADSQNRRVQVFEARGEIP